MADFFSSLENRIYGFLSVLIALNTLFFIALQVSALTLFRLISNNDYFYLGFAAAAVLTLAATAYFSEKFDWKKQLATILLIWLPACVILTFGLNASRNFHYIFPIALGGYVIFSGILISNLFIETERSVKEKDQEALTCREWFRAQGWPALLLVFLATGIFFTFGFYHLTQYASVDEPLWIDGRIARYWKNIGEHDWKGTNISDKPGITVALISGPGNFFKSTKEYRTIHLSGEVFNLKNNVEDYYFAFRFPQLLFIALILPLFYFFLERLTGRGSALLSYTLIATSPVLIGMAKIINPDSLLWIFTPLSLLAYFVFLKRGTFRYLIFSGILLGLALLTKYVSNILFIFFLGLVFLDYLYCPRLVVISFVEYLKKFLKHFALLTFSALATFYILFPAVWIKPSKILTGTLFSQAFEKVAPLFLILIAFVLIDQWFNKTRITSAIIALLEKAKSRIAVAIALIFFLAVLVVAFNAWFGMALYNFTDLLSSPKTIASKSDFIGIYLTNFYPLIFGVTPLIFFSLFIAPFLFFRKHPTESVALRTTFYLIIFILLYYLGTTVNNVGAIVRYQIILFPMAAIIAGVTLEYIFAAINRKFFVRETLTPVFAATAIIIIGTLILFFTPFPLSYASSLLPNQYHIDVKDMGAGSYEVARYLNALPNAKDLLIWTDKDGVCKFFVGRCKRGLNYSKLRDEGLDYIVVSAGRESRTAKMMSGDITNNKTGLIRFDQYYGRADPTFVIYVNGRATHYVKVFKFDTK